MVSVPRKEIAHVRMRSFARRAVLIRALLVASAIELALLSASFSPLTVEL